MMSSPVVEPETVRQRGSGGRQRRWGVARLGLRGDQQGAQQGNVVRRQVGRWHGCERGVGMTRANQYQFGIFVKREVSRSTTRGCANGTGVKNRNGIAQEGQMATARWWARVVLSVYCAIMLVSAATRYVISTGWNPVAWIALADLPTCGMFVVTALFAASWLGYCFAMFRPQLIGCQTVLCVFGHLLMLIAAYPIVMIATWIALDSAVKWFRA
jgi:hypothetical protein